MPKSKYAPALFEVISNKQQENKQAGRLSLPKWWKPARPSSPEAPQGSAGPAPAATTPSAMVPEPANPEVVAESAAPPANTPASVETYDPPVADSPRESGNLGLEIESENAPIVRVSGTRLVLSLNALTATIVGGALVLALFASYQIGHKVGKGSAQTAALAGPGDSLEKALQQPPNPSVLKAPVTPPNRMGLADTLPKQTPPKPAPEPVKPAVQPPPAAVPAPPTPALQRGAIHVVLETFQPTDREAAEFAKTWFESKGIPTTLETKGRSFRLVSVAGFDYTTPTGEQEVAQLIQKVTELGRSCGRALAAAKLPVYTFRKPGTERMERQ